MEMKRVRDCHLTMQDGQHCHRRQVVVFEVSLKGIPKSGPGMSCIRKRVLSQVL